MKRFFQWVASLLFRCALVVAFYCALAAGTYKLLKFGDRAIGLGLWPAELSLESIDPLERADAARLAAKNYGGGK